MEASLGVVGKLKIAWASVDKAIFGQGSPTTFGLFRMIAGLLAFLTMLQILPNFPAFFTEQGYIPSEFSRTWAGDFVRFAPLNNVTNPQITFAVYMVTMVCALLTCVGLFTRVSSILLFLGTVALHHRAAEMLNSGDTLLRQYLFFLAIGPSGAAVSIDRWIQVKKAGGKLALPTISVWPQRLVQVQLAIVYFTTVWWKMMGLKWRDGTATWYPSHLNEFDRFPYPKFIDEVPMIYVTTYGTLLVELALATLVFAKPFRKWVLLAGAGMHLWIEYSMNIPFFSAIIISGYLCFYEGEEVEGWLRKLSAKLKHPAWMSFFVSSVTEEELA